VEDFVFNQPTLKNNQNQLMHSFKISTYIQSMSYIKRGFTVLLSAEHI